VPLLAAAGASASAASPPPRALPPAPLPPARGGLNVLQPGPAARRLGLAFGTASASAVLAVWAVVMVVLLGAAPMAIAAAHRDSPVAAPVSAGYNPMLASAVPKADCHACADRAGPGGAGLVRSSAASAQRVTSAAPGEVTMASPSSS
jgi:hypothetical protein